MLSFFVIVLISTSLIKLSLLLLNLRRPLQFSEKHSWELVNDDRDDNFDRLNGDQIPSKTTISKKGNEYDLSNDFREFTNKLQLHSLAHSDGEHYLTTISISFHLLDKQIFLDILSLDENFSLSNSQFSLLFIGGTQWDFTFKQNDSKKIQQSIPLTCDQLQYMTENMIDKWRIIRKDDGCFTVGALNFETRKYIYKPELQAILQIMARKIQEC